MSFEVVMRIWLMIEDVRQFKRRWPATLFIIGAQSTPHLLRPLWHVSHSDFLKHKMEEYQHPWPWWGDLVHDFIWELKFNQVISQYIEWERSCSHAGSSIFRLRYHRVYLRGTEGCGYVAAEKRVAKIVRSMTLSSSIRCSSMSVNLVADLCHLPSERASGR